MGKLNSRSLVLVALAGLLLASASMAAPIANVNVDAASLQLTPLMSVHGLRLVVDGPNGYYFDQSFDSANQIFLPFDAGMADGIYSYELSSLAPARTRKAGAESRVRPVKIYSQSGAFTVKDGVGVDNSLLENPPTKDIQHLDDVIITFSLCVGNDCVNGESFGFDTVRLKENNLRLHFQDTSTSASFPSNDWRIVINDSSNGGGNYFAVEDSTAARQPFRVDAGAPANSLRVDSGGDVGVGTSNPVVNLHVVDGNTPTLRLEQNGSSGFTAQTFDVAANEANFFVRDVTNGSALSFRIVPGADQDSLFIASNNEIGIGTNNPGALLHALLGGAAHNSSNSATVGLFQNNGATGDGAIISVLSGDQGNAQIFFGDSVQDNAGRFLYRNNIDAMSFFANGAERMRIDSTGDVCIGCDDAAVGADFVVGDLGTTFSSVNAGSTTFTVSSSRALKKNLEPVPAEGILSRISEVDVYTYDFIEGPKDRLGLMAEDFHKIFARGSDKMIDGQDIQMAMWLAIKELTAQNQELAARLAEIEKAEQE